MPELVISDTSPLFYLHRLKQLDLLKHLYQRITIPQAVVDELKAGRDVGEDTPDVTAYNRIEIRPVRVPELIKLVTDLGAGEAQVLALALEEPGSLTIVDDNFARKVAGARGIRVTGTAGILLKAKEKKYISAVTPLLDNLRVMNFRLSDTVIASILKLARE